MNILIIFLSNWKLFYFIHAQIQLQPFPNGPGQIQPQLFPGQFQQQPFPPNAPLQIQPQPFPQNALGQNQQQPLPPNVLAQIQSQSFQNIPGRPIQPQIFPNGQINPNLITGNIQTCSGSNQLPLVDIHTSNLFYDTSIEAVLFEDYNLPVTGAIVNDGRGVRIDFNARGPKIRYGIHLYNLQQMTFHWSQIDNSGSQHLFNGQSFPLELQMLHTREVIPLGENLLTSPDAVIITILFDWLHEPSAFFSENRELSKITNHLQEIGTQGTTTYLQEPLLVNNFLPLDSDSYVRYTGTPTVPPCTATVEWIVMTHTLYVSNAQLQMFRRIQTIQPLRENFIAGASLIDIQPNLRLLQNVGEVHTFKVHNDLGYLNESSRKFVCNYFLTLFFSALNFFIVLLLN